MLLAGLFDEFRPPAGREERVSPDFCIDLRQQQLVGERERAGVELGPTDHEHVGCAVEKEKRFLQRACPLGPLSLPAWIA